MMGLYFEELEMGRVVALGAYEFTAENIRNFKEKFAPVPFHLDDAAAAKGLFGRQVAVGFHLCAAWMPCFVGMNTQARIRLAAEGKALPDIGVGLGLADICWPSPVFAGDVIDYRTTLVSKRTLASKPQWGLLENLNEGLRDGEVVVRFAAKMLVARRGQ
jgi:acyl dehydratase